MKESSHAKLAMTLPAATFPSTVWRVKTYTHARTLTHTHTHTYCIQNNIIQNNKTNYNNLNPGLNMATILTVFLPFVMHFCFALLCILLYFLFWSFLCFPFCFVLLGLCSKTGGTEVSQVGLASHFPWRLLHAGGLSNRVSLEFHISWIIYYCYKLICCLSKDTELQSVSQTFSTSEMGVTSDDSI